MVELLRRRQPPLPLTKLRGERALVTGASSGIGTAYARRLAAAGLDLLLVARRRDRLDALAHHISQRYSVAVDVVAADLSTEAGVDLVLGAVESAPVAVLVASAGFGTRGLFSELDEATTLAMIRLHVESTVRITRACLPAMTEQGRGAVILVSSLAAFWTTSRYVTYAATKSYLNTFAVGLRDEVAPAGVAVQAICPGLTRTEFLDTPEYAEFKYGQVPEPFWMTADGVVDESLARLGSKQTVVVPGLPNRAFAAVLGAPVLGKVIMGAISRASRHGGEQMY